MVMTRRFLFNQFVHHEETPAHDAAAYDCNDNVHDRRFMAYAADSAKGKDETDASNYERTEKSDKLEHVDDETNHINLLIMIII
jgi:hypothetical protein